MNGDEAPEGQADEAVVKRAQGGDSSAFEEIFKRYRHKVFSLSYRMTGNPVEAEDLCQEIFLQVIRKIGSFEGRSSFSTWLYRVATNRSRDYLRRKKRAPDIVIQDDDAQDRGIEDKGSEGIRGDPENSAISSEAQSLVQSALLELPMSLRVPLVLHELEDFQYQEVAGMLGLPVGTVKSRIFRARIKLAEILQPHKEQWE
jgi:RNA polymerase sigma-70 factor, ECF subfamily